VAHTYQSPAFILTDQFLADSFRAVDLFDVEDLPSVDPAAQAGDVQEPYKRFALTDNGISPRALPGTSEHLVVVDSDEHDEEGHITENLAIRQQMVEKRLRKGEGIRNDVIPPDHYGDDESELLLVCWGSSLGAARESALALTRSGVRAGVLHFSQVWPLVPEQFRDKLETARDVILVEGNAGGQFGRILRAETGIHIDRKVLRYDGLPFTSEYVIREIRALLPEIAETGKG
jgi:2-oxoglutarate ferredoxin oxidoreductase subunit alpha